MTTFESRLARTFGGLLILLLATHPGPTFGQDAPKECKPKDGKTLTQPELESCWLTQGHGVYEKYAKSLAMVEQKSDALYQQALTAAKPANPNKLGDNDVRAFHDRLADEWSKAIVGVLDDLEAPIDAARLRIQDALEAGDPRTGKLAVALRRQKAALGEALDKTADLVALQKATLPVDPRKATSKGTARTQLSAVVSRLEGAFFAAWASSTQAALASLGGAGAPPPATTAAVTEANREENPRLAESSSALQVSFVSALTEKGAIFDKKLADDLKALLDKSDDIRTEAMKGFPKPTPAAPRTAEDKAKIQANLGKAWKAAYDKAIGALLDTLNKERGALNETFGKDQGSAHLLDSTLIEERDRVKAALSKKAEEKTATSDQGLKGLNPDDPDGAKDTKEALGLANTELSKELTAVWKASKVRIADRFGETSANDQVAANQQTVKRFLAQEEADYLAELNKKDGFSQIVRCVWNREPLGLVCGPGLHVDASELSVVEIANLPADQEFTVTAYSADRISGPGDGANSCAPASANQPAQYFSCREKTFSRDTSVDRVTIAIYKERLVAPSYGGMVRGRKRAERVLASSQGPNGEAQDLALMITGDAPELVVRIRTKDPTTLRPLVTTATILVGYEKWSIETGGFIGFSRLTDRELTTSQETKKDDMGNDVPTGKLIVNRISEAGGGYNQETGVFLNFIPRNYPVLGWGLGFSTESSRPISMYVGPTVRLRGFGQHAIANLSAGLALRSVRRFPGITVGTVSAPDSSILQGKQEYHIRPYILFELGFGFGPIPGPDGSTKSNTTNR